MFPLLPPLPSGPASPLAFIWWGASWRRVLGTPSTLLGGTVGARGWTGLGDRED